MMVSLGKGRSSVERLLTLLKLSFGLEGQNCETLGVYGAVRVKIGLDLKIVARQVHHDFNLNLIKTNQILKA